jgi:hypothetical protein
MPAEQYPPGAVPPSAVVATQSESTAQLPLQATPEPSQPATSQSCFMSGLHAPSPWQTPPSVAMPSLQAAVAPHGVDALE